MTILEGLEVASYLHGLDNLSRDHQQLQTYWSHRCLGAAGFHPLKSQSRLCALQKSCRSVTWHRRTNAPLIKLSAAGRVVLLRCQEELTRQAVLLSGKNKQMEETRERFQL